MSDGLEARYCHRCQQEETRSVPASGAHEWSDWETLKVPTCIDEGVKARYCQLCGKEEQATLPPMQHDFQDDWYAWKQATCTEAGEEVRFCHRCQQEETRPIPAIGAHEWSDWETLIAPTCIDEGVKVRYCQLCGKEEQATLPPMQHDFQDDWYAWKQATCTEAGEEVRFCHRCQQEETRPIPAIGSHDWSEWQTLQAPFCGQDGEEMRYCLRCTAEQTRIIPAEGEHQWGPWEYTPSYDVYRTCLICGEVENHNGCLKIGIEVPESPSGNGWPVNSTVDYQVTVYNYYDQPVEFTILNADGWGIGGAEAKPGAETYAPPTEMTFNFNITLDPERVETGNVNFKGYYYPLELTLEWKNPYSGRDESSSDWHNIPVDKDSLLQNQEEEDPLKNRMTITTYLAHEPKNPDGFTKGEFFQVGYVVENHYDQPVSGVQVSIIGFLPLYPDMDFAAGQKFDSWIGCTIDNKEIQEGKVSIGPFVLSWIDPVTGKRDYADAPGIEMPVIDLLDIDEDLAPQLVLEYVSYSGFRDEYFPNENHSLRYTVSNVGKTVCYYTGLEIARSDGSVSMEIPSYLVESLPYGESVYSDYLNLLIQGAPGETCTIDLTAKGADMYGIPLSSNTVHLTFPIKNDEPSADPTTPVDFDWTPPEDDNDKLNVQLFEISEAPRKEGYALNEVISFRALFTNLTDIDFYDFAGSIQLLPDLTLEEKKELLPPGSVMELSAAYTVTPQDVERGYASFAAVGTWSGAKVYRAASPALIVPVSKTAEEDYPHLDVYISNTPANGSYFTAGETAEITISVSNPSSDLLMVCELDCSLAEEKPLKTYYEMEPGFKDTVVLNYNITDMDVLKPHVPFNVHLLCHDVAGAPIERYISRAIPVWENSGFDITGIYNPQPEPADAEGPDVEPPMDPFIPGADSGKDGSFDLNPTPNGPGTSGADAGNQPDGSPDASALPNNDGQAAQGVGRIFGTVPPYCYCEEIYDGVYAYHYCEKLAAAAAALEEAAAAPEGTRLALWLRARELFLEQLEKHWKELEDAARGDAVDAVTREREAFKAQLNALEQSLKLLYPNQPEKAEELTVRVLMKRAMDACFETETAPQARQSSILSGRLQKGPGDIPAHCRAEWSDTAAGSVIQETGCASHSALEEYVLKLILQAGEGEEAKAFIRAQYLWLGELDRITNERYRAASAAQRDLIVQERVSFGQWLSARQALLQFLYPDHPEITAEQIEQAIADRVQLLCQAAEK